MRALKQIAIMLMVSMLFSCGVKVRNIPEKMDSSEYNSLLEIRKQHIRDIAKRINIEKLKEETAQSNLFLELLKAEAKGITVGAVSGAITQNAVAAQTLSYATLEALSRIGKEGKSYAIVPIYKDANLKIGNCRFQLIIKYKDESGYKELMKTLEKSNGIFGIEHGFSLTDKDIPNRIIIYLLRWEGSFYRWKVAGLSNAPFIEAVADIQINNKLAGRYYLYGNAVRVLYFGDTNFGSLLDSIAGKRTGFLPYVVPKTFCAEDTKEARK